MNALGNAKWVYKARHYRICLLLLTTLMSLNGQKLVNKIFCFSEIATFAFRSLCLAISAAVGAIIRRPHGATGLAIRARLVAAHAHDRRRRDVARARRRVVRHRHRVVAASAQVQARHAKLRADHNARRLQTQTRFLSLVFLFYTIF